MRRKLTAIACTVLALGILSVPAQPPGKRPLGTTHRALRTVEDFETVKKGDTLGLVCLQCHSISELTVEDTEGAAMYCKEGAEVKCPSCEKRIKTVRHGQPGSKGHDHLKVIYVNSEGDECAFMTKLALADKEDQESE